MKFSEMEYQRIDCDAFTAEMERLIEDFAAAAAGEQAREEAMQALYKGWMHFLTMRSLCYFRHTINTVDEFYSSENDYYDQILPRIESLTTRFYRAVSEKRPELEKSMGALYFKNIDISLRSFDDRLIDDMAEENSLKSAYQKLIASAQIEFDGNTFNLSQLSAPMEDPNRDTRRRALAAQSGFCMELSRELDDIFDKLVKNRTRQAQKLGYKNFVELGYLRRQRNCYDSSDVAAFRKLVQKKLVPAVSKLNEAQRVRLGLDKLMFHDEGLYFSNGNPKPSGTPEQILENGRRMYRELSKETGEFFDYLVDNDLFDVLGRKGKAAGGYFSPLLDYRAPFIFANFNGTYDDVATLTHEAGHAFEYYLSRDHYPLETIEPTLDAAEIDSMSMELFTWPWMELFFRERTDEFRYLHLCSSLKFIPYGCTVDHFQHIIYEHPEMTPAERKQAWQSLEKIYMPDTDYGDDPFLSMGGRWQLKLHIYEEPFYYIDYCLAQACALQFWALDRKDHADAFRRYIKLCGLGGTKTFTGLLDEVGLDSPFREECLDGILNSAQKWLASFSKNA